ILLDYSRKEVNEMQILKQADVVMLLYLFPDLFSKDVILDNLHYYEQHTIHDSSLSKAIHAIVAARCGEITIAYKFFKEACLIDLGPNPKSSDEGIHAASLGSIWLAIVYGFANITFKKDRLALNPKLPAEWEEIQFPIQYRGTKLSISLTKNEINITKVCGPDLIVEIGYQQYLLTQDINVNL
ncbi:glycosyl hydrolase family 65 protein, partial [Priestia megaterium]